MSRVGILVVDGFALWREFVSSVLRSEPSFEIIGEAVDGQQAFVMATTSTGSRVAGCWSAEVKWN